LGALGAKSGTGAINPSKKYKSVINKNIHIRVLLIQNPND
jgi:hypothetical protein